MNVFYRSLVLSSFIAITQHVKAQAPLLPVLSQSNQVELVNTPVSSESNSPESISVNLQNQQSSAPQSLQNNLNDSNSKIGATSGQTILVPIVIDPKTMDRKP